MSSKHPWLKSSVGHYRTHGSIVAQIGLISVLGIIASFGFQIVTARALGPGDFGVLSAFFAIVSIAAIGSASLQNAVAVQTSRSLAMGDTFRRARRIDGFTIEALVLGGSGGLIVVFSSPFIVSGLKTGYIVPILAAISIVLSFVFARAVGTIQGTGNSLAAVWWTSISLVLRLVLVVLVAVAGLGLPGILSSVLVASAVVMVGAMLHSQRLHPPLTHQPFRLDGIVVIVMTIAFAWLTNVDVILLRVFASAEAAGTYAASAMLVKAGFLIPGTISLYLLPRFVRQENNRAMTRLGVRMTLIVTALGAVSMVIFFSLFGGWVAHVLFGAQYRIDNVLLAGLSLAYLPWMLAQGLLIRMSSIASRPALSVLLVAVVLQWPLAAAVLPNIALLIAIIGLLGLLVLVAFWAIDRVTSPAKMRDDLVKP